MENYKQIIEKVNIEELKEELLLREIIEKREELKHLEEEYRKKSSKKRISYKCHNKKLLHFEDYDLEDAKAYLQNLTFK